MKNAFVTAKISARVTDIYLFCRFISLFAAACLLGVYIESRAGYSAAYEIIGGYFSSFYCNSFADFIKNVCRSSCFELVALLAAMGSAFTFFCSAFLHFSCLMCGLVYGICIHELIGVTLQHRLVFCWLYVASVVAFAVVFSVASSVSLGANKRFVSDKRSYRSSKKFFISPMLKQYLMDCLKILALFAVVHILYAGALSIVQTIS